MTRAENTARRQRIKIVGMFWEKIGDPSVVDDLDDALRALVAARRYAANIHGTVTPPQFVLRQW